MQTAVQRALEESSTFAFGVFMVGQAVGVVLHWGAKWLKGEIACVVDMARTEFKWTMGSFVAQALAAIGVFATGIVDGQPIVKAFALGIGGGGLLDAFVNKGRRREWTPEQRERARHRAGRNQGGLG
jgi:hypothetical protein